MALDADQTDAANTLRATAGQLHEPAAPAPPAPTLAPVSVLRVFAKAGYLGLAAWTLLCLIWAASAFSLVGLTPDGSGAVAGGFAILFIGAIWAGGILVGAVVIVATTMLARDVPTSPESGRREWRLAFGVVSIPVAMLGLLWLNALVAPTPATSAVSEPRAPTVGRSPFAPHPGISPPTSWSGSANADQQTPVFVRLVEPWRVEWEASAAAVGTNCQLRVTVFWARPVSTPGHPSGSFEQISEHHAMSTPGTTSGGATVERSGAFYLQIAPGGCEPWTVRVP